MQSKLAAFKIFRRSATVAIFTGHNLDFVDVRHLSNVPKVATETLERFIDWIVQNFHPQTAALASDEDEGHPRTQLLIPITGDADVQSTGRVLRFQKPVNRTAYDADLIGFSRQVHDSLQSLRIQAIGNPTAKTDIFGAIRMAIEEFAAGPKRKERQLIIFSDFIEDDGAVNFNTDRRLAEIQTAIRYAATEAKASLLGQLPRMQVLLGLMQSKDLTRLDKPRRTAIRRFWEEYFKAVGVESRYATDGVGLLVNFSRE